MKFNGKTLSVAAEFTGDVGENLWDALQDYGNRTDYHYGFTGHLWTDETFKPQYPIKPTVCAYMFSNSLVTDITQKNIDFSGITQNTNNARPFADSKIARVGVVDLSNMVQTHNTFFGFDRGESPLVYVERLILPTTGVAVIGANFFQNCNNLEYIRIEGVMLCSEDTLDLSFMPLSVESMASIITHLANLNKMGIGSEKTIKFSSACWQKLDAAGGNPDGDDWWDYVQTCLGWNAESVT